MADMMVIAAHPDDAEIAMGGTLAASIEAGLTVVVVDLTNGEPTPFGTPEIRAEETRAASAVLGITQRELLPLTNREVFDTVQNRRIVASGIRKHTPKVLAIPYWEDAHPDHVQACALSEAARFYSKFVKSDLPHEPFYPRKVLHYFSTHIRVRIQPSFVFDISRQFQKKMAALECYRSQFLVGVQKGEALERIRTEARFWGAQAGCMYGEPFVMRETIRLGDPLTLTTL